MKKRISLLAVLLALVFALSGCSESSEADYDKETLISQADALISSFSQMSSEELDAFKDVNELQMNLTLLQSGFNVDAPDWRRVSYPSDLKRASLLSGGIWKRKQIFMASGRLRIFGGASADFEEIQDSVLYDDEDCLESVQSASK